MHQAQLRLSGFLAKCSGEKARGERLSDEPFREILRPKKRAQDDTQ